MRAVNLIPSDDRRGGGGLGGIGSGRSQGAAFGVLALLAGLALLALVYGLARHQVSSRGTQLAAVQARVNSVQQSSTALSSYTSFIALREERIQAVDTLVDSRFDWAHAMHELGRVMPSGTSITSLDGTIAGTTPGAAGSASAPAATSAASASSTSASTSTSGASAPGASGTAVASATPPGSVPTMTLSGCATSQATVAQMLQRLRLIDGASKVALQSSAKTAKTAGAGAATAAGGSCGNGATFSATLTFEPLPSAPAGAKGGAELTSATGAGQ
jgi:Tfp pilus assembly protein PilN